MSALSYTLHSVRVMASAIMTIFAMGSSIGAIELAATREERNAWSRKRQVKTVLEAMRMVHVNVAQTYLSIPIL